MKKNINGIRMGYENKMKGTELKTKKIVTGKLQYQKPFSKKVV